METITDPVSFPSSSSYTSRMMAVPQGEWKYDVFLSFRGQDTRNNFVSHLHDALRRSQINAFIDDEMQRGDSLSPALEKAIEGSRMAIVVFSPNFASSTWCLRELVKILRTREAKGQMVRPVFHNVDPSEMREQTRLLGNIMADHEKRYGSETVNQWRAAIREAANLIGWHLRDRRESELIQKIVEEVFSKLHRPYLEVAKNPIGLDKHVEAIRMSLHREDACHMVGICGIPGIGKTTIAKAMYNMIADYFEGSSFLANVREISWRYGLHKLQENLLHDILGDETIQIGYVQMGVNLIRQKLCDKRVLLVLDDVDSLEQLKSLVGEKSWFGLGSRVIITARDKDILIAYDAEIYEVTPLNYDEALQLFSWNAFRNPSPMRDFEPMSFLFTRYAGGLPLALIVLGSFLSGKNILEWNHALDTLETIPEGRVDKILRVSFLELGANEREIFLDIACLLKGEDKDEVIKRLHRCNFFPESGLQILVQKSLVYIEANKIWMHDLLQQLGQEIVRLESPENPGKRSRLWSHADVIKVIREKLWTDAIEGIKLDMFEPEEVLMAVKAVKQMRRLRLVIIHDSLVSRCSQYPFNQTNWLTAQGNLLPGISESCDSVDMTRELNSIYPTGSEKDHDGIKTINSKKINFRGALSNFKKVLGKSSNLGKVFSFQVTREQYNLYDYNQTGKLWGFKNFSWGELLRATNNFSHDHLIGLGRSGSVYRGVLDDGREVAVKRFSNKSRYRSRKSFIAEITAGYLKQKNLVRLFGFHEGKSERALVFEYVHNGSLYAHLHTLQSSALRSWKVRLRVALDAARAIEFLHEYAVPPMIHRDVKSSNVLLDDNWSAKVSDFGLSLLVSESEDHSIAGTPGYLDPAVFSKEYGHTSKSDVYGYGAVLLELLSGMKTTNAEEEGWRGLPAFAKSLIDGGEIRSVLDPSMPELGPSEVVAVEDVARLARLCVQSNPEGRPSMTHVVRRLENAVAVLDASVSWGTPSLCLSSPSPSCLSSPRTLSEDSSYSS